MTRRPIAPALVVASAVFVVSCGAAGDSPPASTSADLQLPPVASPIAQEAVRAIPVCPGPTAPADARCHALLVVSGATPDATTGPKGLNPADLWSAYGLSPSAGGVGQTIALVTAFDYPSAEADLGVYRSTFGLTPCTTANGCFRKVDQRGGASYPRSNCGWAQESALDMQMASAICPGCSLILVEADSNSFDNLGAAVNTAARLGATVINNSYGGSEFSGEVAGYRSFYDHPRVAITASTGDSGYGVQAPAAFDTVVAVGGTSLRKSAGVWSETAWSGAGSGCSAYASKPTWQTDPGCARRTLADVGAVADPSTGVSVYDSFRCQGLKGWLVFGGTSVSAPIVAGVYALAGNSGGTDYPASWLYAAAAGGLTDITSGSNGSCGGSYLCTAGVGYDGPTGLGTPWGTGAF